MVHLLKSCALMWWRGLRAMVILKAIPVETLVPGGFNCAAQLWTRIQTNHTTSSSGLGVGEGLMSHPRKQVSLGSLSSDVFERRTSTGSEVFSLLTCLDDIKFVFLSFFTVIEAI